MKIHLRGIQKTYSTLRKKTEVLKNIDLSIEDREFFVLLGPSGCGKSTLLNIIGLLDEPTAGKYSLNGRNVFSMSDGERSDARRDEIGFVFQSFHLLNRMSALDNVCLPMMYAGVDSREMRDRAADLLHKVGLKGKEKKTPLELSGGERQRVSIARALANSPKIILADEPTGNLDSVSSGEIVDTLFKLNGEGITVVMVTHDRELSKRVARNIRMRDGRIEP